MKNTHKHKIALLIMLTALVFVPNFCIADEGVSRAASSSGDTKDFKNFIERGKLSCVASLSEGYDNNTHLNSKRIGDAFTQLFFKANFTSPLSEKRDAILEYELLSLVYASESNLDLIRNGLHYGWDNKLNKNLNFLTGYYLDIIDYVNQGEDDFVDNRFELKLKQKVSQKLFQSLGYEFSFKDYNQRKTRAAAATYNEKTREDKRHTMEYEIGRYFTKDLLRLNYQYYYNTSTEHFLKYYNYDSFELGASLTHILNKKTFAYFSFSRQYRDFRSRTISLDANFKERDRTYLITSALYYNLKKDLTIGLNYTYRENWSNEPTENYSGALITVNTFYRF